MSLDTVELVMEIEETFDITIPDREAEKLQTVGALYRYLLDRVNLSAEPSTCLSSATFYKVRRVLMSEFGLQRQCVRPSTLLEELVPRNERRDRWKRCERALRVKLPELVRPDSMQTSLDQLFCVWFLMSLVTILFFISGELWQLAGIAMGLSCLGLIALLAAYPKTEKFAVEFAPSRRTVRAVVETMIGENIDRHIPKNRRWSEATVWEAVHAIVVAQTGLAPEVVREDSHFVYDLGID